MTQTATRAKPVVAVVQVSAASGLSDTAPDSDLAGRYARGFKAQDLLVLRRADRTTGRLADTASRRGLARFCRRRYARRARFRSGLTYDEAPAKEEPRQPLFGSTPPRYTDFSSQHQEGLHALTGGPVSFVRSDTCCSRHPVPRHR